MPEEPDFYPDEPFSDQVFHQFLALLRLKRQYEAQLSDQQGIKPRDLSVPIPSWSTSPAPRARPRCWPAPPATSPCASASRRAPCRAPSARRSTSALVIDTSGSMAGQGIDDARAAAIALVDQLEPGDRLAVVVFHSRTEVLVPSLIISKNNVADIKARLGAMQATGTTDMGNGLAVGLQQVESNYRQDGLNRVVLLGDGVPNDPSALAGLAQRPASEKITMTMLGLGVDYDGRDLHRTGARRTLALAGSARECR